MSTIQIKDLADSIALDRKAMRAISGGARMRGPQLSIRTEPIGNRIVNYPVTQPLTSIASKTGLLK